MANGDFERTLVLRANDLSSQPIAKVADSLRQLTTVLTAQIEAANKGTARTQDFAKALKSVEDIGLSLNKQQSLLGNVEPKLAQLDRVSAKLEEVRKKRDAFAASLSNDPAGRDDKQMATLERLNAAVARQERMQRSAGEAVERTTAQLQRMGVTTEGVADAQREVNRLQLEAQRVLSSAGETDRMLPVLRQRAEAAREVTRAWQQFHAEAATYWDKETAKENEAVRKTAEATAAAARFREELNKAVERADTAIGRTRDLERAATAARAVPAPGTTDRVAGALGTAPGVAPELRDIQAVQLKVADLGHELRSGSGPVADYTRYVREMDTAIRELGREAGIVESFQKQKVSADAAVAALKAAGTELNNLRRDLHVAAEAQDRERVSEVTSRIEEVRRNIGNVTPTGGSGLAGEASRQLQGLERERDALRDIRVAEADVERAADSLTIAATRASAARTEAYNREQTAIRAAGDAALNSASAIDAARNAPLPVAPAAAARVTGAGVLPRGQGEIADTDAAISKLEQTFSRGKLNVEGYNRAVEQALRVQTQLAKDASLIDSLRSQAGALAEADAKFKELKADVTALATAARAGQGDVAALTAAEARLAASGSDFRARVTAMQALEAQLKGRRIDTANLTTETDKLVQAAQRLKTAQEGASTRQTGFLGLSAYQTQNLGYQVNDVVTQLSLGQGVLRTIESQGGQILQIFGGANFAVGRFLLVAAPAVAVVGTLVAAMLRLKETADAMRETRSLTLFDVDGANYQVEGILKVRRALEQYGTSFEDTQKAVRQFMGSGINQAFFESLGRVAQNLVDGHVVTDYADALKILKTATTGTKDEIFSLNRELGFLTAAQADAIIKAYEAGDADKAHALAVGALGEQAGIAAKDGVSPLTQASRELRTSWGAFLDVIGHSTALRLVVSDLKDLVTWTTNGIVALRRFFSGTDAAEQLDKRIKSLRDELENTNARLNKLLEDKKPGSENAIAALQRDADRLKDSLQTALDLKERLATAGPNAPGTVAPGAAGPTPGADGGAGRIVSSTVNDHTYQINERYKAAFDGFIRDLEATGYRIRSLGGYNDRSIAGTNTPSYHAQGAAIDINPDQNGVNSSGNMPGNIREIARKWGLGWGGDWTGGKTDPMHFSIARQEGGTIDLPHISLPPGGGTANGGGSGMTGVPSDIVPMLADAAKKTGVAVELLAQLYRNEAVRASDGSFATSAQGARGPLQVMPGTFDQMVSENHEAFEKLQQTLGRPIRIDDSAFNSLAGAFYYKQQLANNAGDPVKAAGAYNAGGAGFAAMLAGTKEFAKETRDYVAKFAAGIGTEIRDPRMLGGNAGRPLTPGQAPIGGNLATPGTQRQGVAESELIDKINKTIEGMRDTTKKGIQAIAEDEAIEAAKLKEDLERAANQLGHAPSEAARAKIVELSRKRAELMRAKRKKEQEDMEREAGEALGTVEQQLASSDPTNAEAQRRAVNIRYDRTAETLRQKIRDGMGEVVVDGIRTSASGLLARLEEARGKALEKATIDADQSAVDTAVKARDEAVAALSARFKEGGLTLKDYFARLNEIMSRFNPQVKAAVARALEDLRGQPQTPKIQERTERLGKAEAGTTGSAAYREADAAALVRINELEKARNDTVKEQDDLLRLNVITQRERDRNVQAAYSKARGPIKEYADALQTEINTQKELGVISPEAYERMSAAIRKAKAETETLTGVTKVLTDGLPGVVSGAAVQAFDSMSDAIGRGIAGTEKWNDVLKDIGNSFLKFFADVAKNVANMIISFEIAAAVKAALVLHSGGVVGTGGTSRSVDPSIFYGAARYHSGGMIGLSKDEVPAILQKGEEVLTKTDPRHRYNLGKNAPGRGDGGAQSIRNVMVFKDEDIASAMAGSHGEQVIMNHLRRNSTAVRQLVGASGTRK